MATYDYKCPKCQVILEIAHPINEKPELKCETCQSVLNKVYSAPSVTFKGNGWGSQ
jgi:putative FmdB family regulatory protein